MSWWRMGRRGAWLGQPPSCTEAKGEVSEGKDMLDEDDFLVTVLFVSSRRYHDAKIVCKFWVKLLDVIAVAPIYVSGAPIMVFSSSALFEMHAR